MSRIGLAVFLTLISIHSSADSIQTIHYILGTQSQIARAAAEIQKKWCVELFVNSIEDNFSGFDEDRNGFVNDSTGWDLINMRPAEKSVYAPLFGRKNPSPDNLVQSGLNDPRVHGCSKAVPVVTDLPSNLGLSRAVGYIGNHYLVRTINERYKGTLRSATILIVHVPANVRTEMHLLEKVKSIKVPSQTPIQIQTF